jgi:hypothetical protein
MAEQGIPLTAQTAVINNATRQHWCRPIACAPATHAPVPMAVSRANCAVLLKPRQSGHTGGGECVHPEQIQWSKAASQEHCSYWGFIWD